MSTSKRDSALSTEGARRRIAETSFRRPGPAEVAALPGRIGLEPEGFPIRTDPTGRPIGRMPLAGADGSLALLDGLAEAAELVRSRPVGQGAPPWFELVDGGRLTFEPGGQIEHSTEVHANGSAAIDDVCRVSEKLGAALAERGVTLAYLGLDPWNDVVDVPQQLDAPRYRCMANYFAKRGTGGRTMMRHTASLQVNLDLGDPGVAEERWCLANLVSPLATATFASSPRDGAVSARAQAWQVLDETRTGFPARLVDGDDDDPVAHWTAAALAADVMIFWKPDGTATCGEPGFDFARWIREGHPEFGWPTVADLDYHLTTLFFEVRPRGFFELRAIEAVPPRWRAAPPVLFAGLLYDPAARRKALELLAPARARLPELWKRAAAVGFADAELLGYATEVWSLALAGARALAKGYFREEHLVTAREFLEEFAFRGRSPADELASVLAVGPAEALAWASSSPATCPEQDPAR